MTRALVGIAALLAACGDPPAGTSVRLDVRYEDDWSLTAFDVSVGTDRAETAVAPAVVVLVPDAWATQSIELEVIGLQAGERWAAGRVGVTPELGREVRAEVTLTRLPCGAWCTPGATTCAGDGAAICEQRDGDDCLEWSAPIACPAEAPACSFGICAATCFDECAEGQARCAGAGGVQRCGQADSDSCRDWLPALPCPDGETCGLGECRGACVDECEPGAVMCAGSGPSACGDRDADGCLEWGPPAPCPAGETCSAGVCSATCTDECDAATCDGLIHRPCGQFDLDACTDQGVGLSCLPVDPCQAGACAADGCLSAPRVCEEPPPSTCVDGGTLRTYDRVGTCGAGICQYVVHDRACANCPACDACAGVVCDQPPSPCHASPGTCEAGACRYEYADGASCSDGNACTTGDECLAGACDGAPVSCASPPPPTCVDGMTLRTYRAPGACGGGGCSYPFLDATCPSACSGGACVCAESTCSAETLASGSGGGRDVAVDATHIYWATSFGKLMRRPKGPGTVTTVATGQLSVNRIALDDTHVYWASYDGGAIRRVAKSGGLIETLASGSIGMIGLAVDATHVYWTNTLTGEVMRCPKGGGPPETIAVEQPDPVRVAVDDTHVYWTNQRGDVMRRTKTGGAVETFAATLSARDLVLDGDVVYWTDGFYPNPTPVLIQRKAKTGGEVGTFAIEDHITGIAVDATYVYWGNDAETTTVHRRHKLAGNTEPLTQTPGDVFDVAVDDGYVYWIRNYFDVNNPVHSVGRLSRCACGL